MSGRMPNYSAMQNPIEQFSQWLEMARAHPAIHEPTAMTLATATAQGKPSARIVLLKEHGPQGFLFYTNHESRKSAELKANPFAALCFYWMPLDRQIRIEGRITPSSAEEADRYFASRPRARQIGAWASYQSQPMPTRDALDNRVAELTAHYEGRDIPRPPHWSGWRLTPESIEFWVQSEARLHERYIYRREGERWVHTFLYP